MADDTIKTFTPRFKLRYQDAKKTYNTALDRVFLYVSEPDAPTKLSEERCYLTNKDGYAASPDDPDDPHSLLELPAANQTYGFYHSHERVDQAALDRVSKALIDQRKLTAADAATGVIYLRSCSELAPTLHTIGGVPVRQLGDFGGVQPKHNPTVKMEAIFYRAGLKIDADGAPNCYHPNDIADALDYRDNGGHGPKQVVKMEGKGKDRKPVLDKDKKPVMVTEPANWWAVITDTGESTGTPETQPDGDFKGYFVTFTAIGDPSKKDKDITKWVDSRVVPYISVPAQLKLRKGDMCFVYNGMNQLYSTGIVADTGPNDSAGEASIKMADLVGGYKDWMRRDAKKQTVPGKPKSKEYPGIDDKKLAYVVFAGTARSPSWPVSVEDIEDVTGVYFKAWGGFARLKCCFPELFPSELEKAPDAKPADVKPGVKPAGGK